MKVQPAELYFVFHVQFLKLTITIISYNSLIDK